MKAYAADVRRFFGLVARPGDVFELRGLARYNGQQQVSTGFFDDVELLALAALDRSGQDDGVYVTINPVNPALLARAPKNKIRRAGSGDTTSDRDVSQRRIILVDVDPVRPTGISSTNDEHLGALVLGWEIAADLCALGWPNPIFASSGNGAHLLYAVDLPVDDGGLVMRVLKQLSKRYSTLQLKVDEKVFNPARISKIYGTLTRKGEDTEDRPHRIARIIEAPDALVVIARETLEAFAPSDTTRQTTDARSSRQPATYSTERATFNADDFIAQHLPDAKERSWASGRKWILPVCPFNDSHDRGEAHLEQLHSGAMSAGCLHESCKWGWKDLRKKFEPDAYAWEERRANGTTPPLNGQRVSDRQPPPEVVYENEEYAAELDAFADRDREPADEAKEEPPPLLITIEQAINELAPLAKMPIYPTPFPTLNDAIGFGGLLGTQVYTVAAGTGRGKTSWVAAVAAHAAATVPVIVATYEMKPGYFVARKAASVLGCHSNSIFRGEISTAAVMRAMPYPNFFLMRKPTLKELRRAVEYVTKKYGTPPLVIVDYLQKLADEIASKQSRPDLRMATTEASSVLLDIGDTTGAAIIAVSAIGRGKMRSHDKLRKMEPYELVELAKESGAVEYDGAAMIVLSLSNDFEEENGELLRIGTMTLAKARFGTEMHIAARYSGRRGGWWDRGQVHAVPGFETTPPPAPQEEGREDVVRKLIVAELQRRPARTKTELLTRMRGCRKEVAKEVYEAMWIKGEIAKVGLGVALTEIGRQLAIEDVK